MVSSAQCPYHDFFTRTVFHRNHASIQARPSYGGLIVLDPAYAPDFHFLGLDPLNPPLTNYLQVDHDSAKASAAQELEDAFSQRLLLLGAKWYDSEKRYHLLSMMEDVALGVTGQGQPFSEIRVDQVYGLDKAPQPTMREKRLVRMGWPSTGGFWIAEYDTTWGGVDEEDNLGPPSPSESVEDENDHGVDWARLGLATTMDERCKLLKEIFGAKYYQDVAAYRGYAFLNAWAWESIHKGDGEVGLLLTHDETVNNWFDTYSRRFG